MLRDFVLLFLFHMMFYHVIKIASVFMGDEPLSLCVLGIFSLLFCCCCLGKKLHQFSSEWSWTSDLFDPISFTWSTFHIFMIFSIKFALYVSQMSWRGYIKVSTQLKSLTEQFIKNGIEWFDALKITTALNISVN